MKLNGKKCELMAFGRVGEIRLGDGTVLKPVEEARYLGSCVNVKADGSREVRKRIAECMDVLKRLDLFWRHGESSVRRKIQIQRAVIDTKLMFGLESLELNRSAMRMLDVFQLKGLRKILKMETTFVNRANTNEEVFRRARQALAEGHPPEGGGLRRLSEVYEGNKMRFLAEVIAGGDRDPRFRVALDPGTLTTYWYGTRRVGRPRGKWAEEAIKLFWARKVSRGWEVLDLGNNEHRLRIKDAAAVEAGWKVRRPRSSRRRERYEGGTPGGAQGREGWV
jgi:hypothetical protein